MNGPPAPRPEPIASELQPGALASCAAITQLTWRERRQVADRYGAEPLFNHPERPCDQQAGHSGPHVVHVVEVDPETQLWLHWTESDERTWATAPYCRHSLPPPPGELDGELCFFPDGHWGSHTWDTDWKIRCHRWWETHEPYRREREQLYAMLGDGFGGGLGPAPGRPSGRRDLWSPEYPHVASLPAETDEEWTPSPALHALAELCAALGPRALELRALFPLSRAQRRPVLRAVARTGNSSLALVCALAGEEPFEERPEVIEWRGEGPVDDAVTRAVAALVEVADAARALAVEVHDSGPPTGRRREEIARGYAVLHQSVAPVLEALAAG